MSRVGKVPIAVREITVDIDGPIVIKARKGNSRDVHQ